MSSDPTSITSEALEILVVRELRKAGIEPVPMRRHRLEAGGAGFAFDLVGKLAAYGQRWSALIACSNVRTPATAADVIAARRRADAAEVTSALLCTTAVVAPDAVAQGQQMRVPLLRVVDAQDALTKAGMIQPGQLPAWVPEFTLEIVTELHAARLLAANEPELILRALRTNDSA